MASVNDAIVALVHFFLCPPSGEGQREPRWVWSTGKGEGLDPILEPCPSSRCTLPREKGNGSQPRYGSGEKARVNDAIVALVHFPLYPPSGEGHREPRWVWSKGKGEGFDPILEPCPSSRCTLPREKGNGSLPGYGSGKWRASTTRYSCLFTSR